MTTLKTLDLVNHAGIQLEQFQLVNDGRALAVAWFKNGRFDMFETARGADVEAARHWVVSVIKGREGQ